MIRLVFLLRRRPELSLGEFQRVWLEEHAPLVASFQTSLDIVRYTQTHRVDDPANAAMAKARGGMEDPYDGVAELWWASEQALAAASATAAGRAAGVALVNDEARFIDLPHSPLWLAHEYPQVNPKGEADVAHPGSGKLKLHFPLRALPSLSFDDAQRYWRVQHGPLIRTMAPGMGLLRYMQVHRYETPLEDALRSARGTVTEPYLGHAEVWTDTAQARSRDASDAGRHAITDERTFIDFARSAMWFGHEHVIVDRRHRLLPE